MTIYETLQRTGLPCAYSHFQKPVEPPFLVYIGAGSNIFRADNTHYETRNQYQIEYYFTTKNETAEAAIESTLLADGWVFTKSEDAFIESEGLFVIYYQV